MATNEINMDAQKLMSRVTMTVHIIETPKFKIRKWIAIQLVSLASVVLGCNFEPDDESEKEGSK